MPGLPRTFAARPMLQAEIDRTRRLITITAEGYIEPADVKSALIAIQALLAHVEPGFRLLTDLSRVESMSVTVAPDIGRIMELCARKGSELVVRILPKEPKNDIGFAIMSQFHYGSQVHIVTCDTLEEAERILAD